MPSVVLSVSLFPFSQAASVAILPPALFFERFSLGASWAYSVQQVLPPETPENTNHASSPLTSTVAAPPS